MHNIHIQVASSLRLLATCSLIAPASAAAPIAPTFSVGHFYQRNCTEELLVRNPHLSYALMGGCISPLIFWLVQFRGFRKLDPFSWCDSFLESGYSLSYSTNLFQALFNFTQRLDSYTQLVFVQSIKLQYCIYIHVPVPNCISVAGCLCPFSGSFS